MSNINKVVTKRHRAAAVLIGVVVLAVVFTLVALAVTPVKYDIAAGDVAPATIAASEAIEDTVSTEAERAQVMDDVAGGLFVVGRHSGG